MKNSFLDTNILWWLCLGGIFDCDIFFVFGLVRILRGMGWGGNDKYINTLYFCFFKSSKNVLYRASKTLCVLFTFLIRYILPFLSRKTRKMNLKAPINYKPKKSPSSASECTVKLKEPFKMAPANPTIYASII